METRYQITAEMMAKAKDYVRIDVKEAFAIVASVGCVQPSKDYDAEGNEIPLKDRDQAEKIAPLYTEDTHFKSRVLLGAILYFYFGIESGRDSLTLNSIEYDGWSAAHIMSQIERFKSDPALKNKAFEMLADIRDLEKRLNNAIHSLLKTRNDPVRRAVEVMTKLFSAEYISNAVQEIAEAQQGIIEEKEKQEAFIASLPHEGESENG